MNWTTVFTIATPIIVAALALFGTVWGKSLSKRTDVATARRTEAEGEKTHVETARSLMDEVRNLYNEQRTLNAEQRLDYEKRLSGTRGELTALVERFKTVEVRQAALIAALAAHAPWDFAAYEALRQTFKSYPPPPPLDPDPIVSLRRGPRRSNEEPAIRDSEDDADTTIGVD
jgi:hypothetical protein